MAYKTCPDCGERVYNLGCTNCNEAAYVEEQDRLTDLYHPEVDPLLDEVAPPGDPVSPAPHQE